MYALSHALSYAFSTSTNSVSYLLQIIFHPVENNNPGKTQIFANSGYVLVLKLDDSTQTAATQA